MTERSGRRRDLGIILGLTVLAAAPFARALAAGVPVNFGDLTQFYFWQHYLVQSLRAGDLPLWNPYALSGGPFVANPQVQAFYPLNLLLLAGPLRITITLCAIAHLWLGGALQYAYLRSLGLRRLAACLGAVCFMLGGHLIAGYYAQNVTRNCALVWLPGMLWAAHMAVSKRSAPWALAGAGFVGLSIFAGFPQTTAYAIILVFGQVALSQAMCGTIRLRALAADWAMTSGFLLLAAGLTAVQALPSLELLRLSVRQAPSFDFASLGSLPPYQVAAFALPNVFGSPAYHNSVFGAMFWEACVYVGVVPLMLLMVPAAGGRQALLKRFFLLFAAAFLIVALGRYTPVWRLIYDHVPFANTFRFPARALGMVQFVLACSAAVAVASLAQWRRTKSERLAWSLTWSAAATFGLGAALAGSVLFRERLLSASRTLIESRYSGAEIATKLAKLPGLIALQQQAILIALLFAVLGLALLIVCRRGLLTPRPAIAAALLAATADLLVFAFPLMRPGDFAKHAAPPAYSSALSLDRNSYRILPMSEALFERNSGPVNGYQNVHGYDPLILASYARFVARINGTDVTSFTPNTADITAPDSSLVRLLNARYVISTKPLRSGKLRLVQRRPSLFVYENTAALPRAWLVPEALVVGNDDAALDHVAGAHFDPTRQVVISGSNAASLGAGPGSAAAGRGGSGKDLGTVTVRSQQSDQISLHVSCARDCYVVLSEVYCPGWEAWVDATPVPVMRANYAFRAVAVRKGTHHVELRYRPRSIRAGAWISALSILLAVAMLIPSQGGRGRPRSIR